MDLANDSPEQLHFILAVEVEVGMRRRGWSRGAAEAEKRKRKTRKEAQ